MIKPHLCSIGDICSDTLQLWCKVQTFVSGNHETAKDSSKSILIEPFLFSIRLSTLIRILVYPLKIMPVHLPNKGRHSHRTDSNACVNITN